MWCIALCNLSCYFDYQDKHLGFVVTTSFQTLSYANHADCGVSKLPSCKVAILTLADFAAR